MTAELGLDFKDQLDTQRETFFFCRLVLYFSLFFFLFLMLRVFLTMPLFLRIIFTNLLTAVHAL